MPAPAKRAAPAKGNRLAANLARRSELPAAAKPAAKPASKPASKPTSKNLGMLPEWNLTDLYAGIDDPKVKRDLDRTDEYCKAFEDDFKGKLAALAERPEGGAVLAQEVIGYEELDDVLGRVILYGGLGAVEN